MLVIFPFEEAIYRQGGVPVEFVGHPLVDLVRRAGVPRRISCAGSACDPTRQTVAVLPGSRPNEVSRILPDLLAACRLIAERVPGVQFVVARAPHLDDRAVPRRRRPRPGCGSAWSKARPTRCWRRPTWR